MATTHYSFTLTLCVLLAGNSGVRRPKECSKGGFIIAVDCSEVHGKAAIIVREDQGEFFEFHHCNVLHDMTKLSSSCGPPREAIVDSWCGTISEKESVKDTHFGPQSDPCRRGAFQVKLGGNCNLDLGALFSHAWALGAGAPRWVCYISVK